MRVTTLGTTQASFQGIEARQSAQTRLQNQLGTGLRVNSPGDDPLGAAQAELARSRLAHLAQDQRSAQLATSVLSAADTALADGVGTLQSVREALVAAGNGGYNATDRQALVVQLRAAREQLVALANTRDGAGGHVFAGQGSAGAPLTAGATPAWNAASGVQRLGDDMQFAATLDGRAAFMAQPQGNGVFVTDSAAGNTGAGWINPGDVADPTQLTGHNYSITLAAGGGGLEYTVTDLTAGTTLAAGVPFVAGATITLDGQRIRIAGTPAAGDSFSVGPAGKQSIFQTLDDAIATLSQPYNAAAYSQGLERAQVSLDGALDSLVLMRAGVGAELQRVDSATATHTQEDLHLQQRRSDLVDLDYAAAISDLQNNQTALQAAMQAYASVARTSLFQMLG
ncbi:MAG: flagellar hook-associated protein FlgL [Ramlibacter sp.]